MKDKAKTKKPGFFKTLGGFIVIFCMFGAMLPSEDLSPEAVAAGSERDQQKAEARMERYLRRCTVDRYDIGAYVAAQTAVKRRLNDPRSARFPITPPNMRLDKSDCSFRFAGSYSAKNGFGGRIRGNYAIHIRRQINGDWHVLDFAAS